LRDLRAVGEQRLLAHGAGAVHLAERVGKPEARRRERLEAERGEQLRAARVPGIRNDEHAGALVQRAECAGLLLLRAHPGTRKRPLMILRVGVSGISGITTRRSGSLFFAISFARRYATTSSRSGASLPGLTV